MQPFAIDNPDVCQFVMPVGELFRNGSTDRRNVSAEDF